MAEDTGLSPLADRTEVEISIVDVNDNAPRFSSVHYHGSVHENVPAGTSILEVRTHHMFLRILNFLFVLNCVLEQKNSILYKENNSYNL